MHCAVPEIIHTPPPPRRVIGNLKGEGGVKNATIFERKYETKLEFPEGWGLKLKKKHCGRGVDIFCNSVLPKTLPKFEAN